MDWGWEGKLTRPFNVDTVGLMRLTSHELSEIRRVILGCDPKAHIYLFGSRTEKNRSGGDIDLLVESKVIDFSSKISILADLKVALGDQKIDIVISTSLKKDPDPFVRSIRDQLVSL